MEIVAHGLRHGYRDQLLLDGIELRLGPGRLFAILGPSGSGKSTLLRLLAGRERPRGGSVRWDGTDPHRSAGLRRRHSGWLPQAPWLEDDERVIDTVLAAAAFRRINSAATRAEQLIDSLGLSDLRQRRLGELSGGQRVRVALARALLPAPQVLFVDEPSASLDPAASIQVAEALRAVAAQGTAVLVATHDPVLAEAAESALDLSDLSSRSRSCD